MSDERVEAERAGRAVRARRWAKLWRGERLDAASMRRRSARLNQWRWANSEAVMRYLSWREDVRL